MVADALEPFNEQDRERIIRWARERLGMSVSEHRQVPASAAPIKAPAAIDAPVETTTASSLSDIRSFVTQKAPKNDSQFCAVVAYYYLFEAPQDQRKDTISGDDLQEAARKVNRDRFVRPAQTLMNAYTSGYLDKAEYAKYKLNTVGENLVAMVLPGGGEADAPRPRKKPAKKKAAKK